MELILTAEDLLRLTGSHKRFISGRKTVQPNHQVSIQNELDEIEEESNFCVSALLRFAVSIYYGFKEFKYQLWGGERYDTLENLQEALSSQLVRWTMYKLAKKKLARSSVDLLVCPKTSEILCNQYILSCFYY